MGSHFEHRHQQRLHRRHVSRIKPLSFRSTLIECSLACCRYWYGYVFRGGPTDESFYVRDEDEASNVTLSKAWTIVE